MGDGGRDQHPNQIAKSTSEEVRDCLKILNDLTEKLTFEMSTNTEVQFQPIPFHHSGIDFEILHPHIQVSSTVKEYGPLFSLNE